MKKRIKIICVLLLIALVFSISGCQSAPAAEKPKVINVSFSLRPINVPSVVALEKKIFEEAFAKDGIEVKWYELEGPATTEALAAQSIDIATSLNYVSAIVSKANGNDIKIISSYSQFPKAIGLAAHVDSGVNAASDLKGKKIAVQKGTMLHEMLIRILDEQKIAAGEVEIVGMASPDAANALLQKHVDAAILPEPLLGKVISSKNARLLTDAEGLILGQSVIAARSDFLKQYPEIAERFLEVHQGLLDWIDANNDEALSMTAAKNQMEIKAVQSLYPKFDFTLNITEKNTSDLRDSAEFLKQNQFIKAETDTQALISNLVDLSYLNP